MGRVYTSLRAISAQAIRAVLLARATAALLAVLRLFWRSGSWRRATFMMGRCQAQV